MWFEIVLWSDCKQHTQHTYLSIKHFSDVTLLFEQWIRGMLGRILMVLAMKTLIINLVYIRCFRKKNFIRNSHNPDMNSHNWLCLLMPDGEDEH